MPNTLKIAPDLYSKPPKTAIPGAKFDYRTIALVVGDLITTQLIALACLPAGHRLVSCFLECDILDSNATATITVSVGILNTYYNQPAAGSAGSSLPVADYNNATGRTESPSTQTNTDVDPQLVTGHNIITASALAGTTGAAYRVTPTLPFTNAIGVDSKKDRIIAVQFPALPATAHAGNLSLTIGIDQTD